MQQTRETVPACPVCGTPLQQRPGRPGRPAAWCSKPCRQAAYRARRNAARAAEQAADLRAQLAAAHAELHEAEAVVASAYGRAADVAADPTATPADHMTRPGWERPLFDAARALGRAAFRLADLANDHARTRNEHRAAMATFRQAPAPRPSDDATAPAEAAAEVQVSDVDELFDAAEDVIAAFISGTLPPEMAAAWRPAFRQLETAFQDASGDDFGALAAAAARLAGYLTETSIRSGEAPPVLVRLARCVRET
ncbi:hypothetical protein ACQP1W_52430 (plasmid) [Spirillospora sp. CA-255316]